VREETPEFTKELGRQGLVRRDDQGGPLDAGDDMRHGEGLARAGHPEEDLMGKTVLDAAGKRIDGMGLVTAGLQFGHEFKHQISRSCP
jgi:hypothetical protein